MDRLGAALAEAQQITADKPCPSCGRIFKGSRQAWRLNHMLHCGHEPVFTPAPWEPQPVAMCRECGGECTPAHRRRLRATRQHRKHAA